MPGRPEGAISLGYARSATECSDRYLARRAWPAVGGAIGGTLSEADLPGVQVDEDEGCQPQDGIDEILEATVYTPRNGGCEEQ